jgi:threonine dehydrogenase-like Zn-dependent dehydrogenase
MAEKALAMVLEQFGQPLVPRDFEVPEPLPGAAVVKILAAGVCGSDLDITAGDDPRVPLPLIPGHEAIAEIVAVGGDKRDAFGEVLQAGDRVAFNRGLMCGRCVYCAIKHEPALCPYRRTYGISVPASEWPHLNGCYAEMLYLRPESEIIKLPPEAEPAWLVPATCSGATAAHAVELCNLAVGDTVVILGPGPLGLYAAALAQAQGAAQVIMIGTARSRNRLNLAEMIGCLPVSMGDTTAAERLEIVRGLTHGFGAEAVIDCAGNPDSLAEAVELVAPGGVVALPGVATPVGKLTLDPYPISRKQIRLQGVWVSGARHLYQAVMLACSNRFSLDAMVTHVVPLSQANEGLELLRSRAAIKVVLTDE